MLFRAILEDLNILRNEDIELDNATWFKNLLTILSFQTVQKKPSAEPEASNSYKGEEIKEDQVKNKKTFQAGQDSSFFPVLSKPKRSAMEIPKTPLSIPLYQEKRVPKKMTHLPPIQE